ncbi:MAG: hypothetical protein H7842_02405 [Gammaproteobacteria bacterium SHHR-1]
MNVATLTSNMLSVIDTNSTMRRWCIPVAHIAGVELPYYDNLQQSTLIRVSIWVTDTSIECDFKTLPEALAFMEELTVVLDNFYTKRK